LAFEAADFLFDDLAAVNNTQRATPHLPFRLQPRPWARLKERAGTKAIGAEGSRRVAPIVLLTSVLGMLALFTTSKVVGTVSPSGMSLAAALVLLGLGAELLSFNQSKESAGSAAVIPFGAAVLVAPYAATVALIIAAEVAAQGLHRRSAIKAVFNLAQHTLGLSLAILVLYWAEAPSFALLKGSSFFECVKLLLMPTVLLIATVQFVNNSLVSAVIAVSARRPFLPLWGSNLRLGATSVLINVAVTFYVTWLCVTIGILGAAPAIVLPILVVRQLYRTTVELTNVTEELLELMVAAIEARDAYTSGHSRRVALASEIIAKALGLSPAEVERVTVAALLHDVGKIDEKFGPILAKEGRLTPEEWEIMKQHPIRGSQLVGLLSSLKDIVKPVRHHHENWDGTGYPDGLRGDQIPLASRIIMFADTLDAITTDRPYRKALGIEEARAEFVRFRGKQFDPGICDQVVSAPVWSELYDTFVGKARAIHKVAS
jgi:HD-GYP domain-containing protein (c-di-GMP phosphodiesterase class II)